MATGFGKFINEEQEVYEGYFVNDMPHGQGLQKFNNGAYYKGNFENGSKHGQG